MDQRFCLPEGWFTAADAARRTNGQGPEGLTFHPKPQVAVESFRDLDQAAMVACTYMVAHGLSGKSPEFLDAAAPCGGKISFVALPSATRCGVQGPVPPPTRDTEKGEERTKRGVRPTEQAPIAVAGLAQSLQDGFW